jgi:hypothetical protein
LLGNHAEIKPMCVRSIARGSSPQASGATISTSPAASFRATERTEPVRSWVRSPFPKHPRGSGRAKPAHLCCFAWLRVISRATSRGSFSQAIKRVANAPRVNVMVAPRAPVSSTGGIVIDASQQIALVPRHCRETAARSPRRLCSSSVTTSASRPKLTDRACAP